MSLKLFISAILKYLLGILVVGGLLFIPAGSFKYWNGWLFMGVLFIPMFFAGIVLMFKNPELLKKRLDAKEKEMEQKKVVIFSALMFITGFIIAGLNYRNKWLEISNVVVIFSSIIFLISYVFYAEVLKENTYLSRNIKVTKDQKLIDTGLYKIVRHPMYLITIVLFLTMTLILGSIISFCVFLLYPFIIAKRIKNEEEILEKNLKGYTEYKRKVKYRLIPFIW